MTSHDAMLLMTAHDAMPLMTSNDSHAPYDIASVTAMPLMTSYDTDGNLCFPSARKTSWDVLLQLVLFDDDELMLNVLRCHLTY